jgi:hypothetical protein
MMDQWGFGIASWFVCDCAKSRNVSCQRVETDSHLARRQIRSRGRRFGTVLALPIYQARRSLF